MDVLTSVLATLITWELGVPSVCDSNNPEIIRIYVPRRSFSYLLAMLDPIRTYGASDLSVCRRSLRLLGDLGMILTSLDQIDVIPTILVQLKQWMNVARENFSQDELKSLEDLHEHQLRSIAESDNVVVKDENGIKDLDHFLTTYNKVDEKDSNAGDGGGKEDKISATASKLEGNSEPSMSTMVSEFLSRVNFGSDS